MKWLSFCSSLLLYLLILKLEFAIVVTRRSVSSIKALFNEFISFPGYLRGEPGNETVNLRCLLWLDI